MTEVWIWIHQSPVSVLNLCIPAFSEKDQSVNERQLSFPVPPKAAPSQSPHWFFLIPPGSEMCRATGFSSQAAPLYSRWVISSALSHRLTSPKCSWISPQSPKCARISDCLQDFPTWMSNKNLKRNKWIKWPRHMLGWGMQGLWGHKDKGRTEATALGSRTLRLAHVIPSRHSHATHRD